MAEGDLFAELLAQAKRCEVAISSIVLDDLRYSFRNAVTLACDPAELIVEHGLVDLSRDHKVILQAVDDRFRVVSGFRRMKSLRKLGKTTRILCWVLPATAGLAAEILAARQNLQHGQRLKPLERRRAFYAEYDARKAARWPMPSLRDFARAFKVAPATPQNWINMRDRHARAEELENARESDQIEHIVGDTARAIVGHASSCPAPEVQPDATPAGSCSVGKRTSPREAAECLHTAVEMLDSLPTERLSEVIAEASAAYLRLGEILRRCPEPDGGPAQ
jgi:hypothetical protein